MKGILQVIILVLFPLIGFSQPGTTIFYDDNFGDGGILDYVSDVNGRPSYSGPANGVTVTVTWSVDNRRWEIDLSPPGVGLTFINTSDSQNPPDLTLGTWVNLPMDGTTLDAFSGSGTSDVVLPVELISFRATYAGKKLMLNWETALETNNEKFEIETSNNGRIFQKIGEIAGRGTITAGQNYSFEVQYLIEGISYYRLKQIDFDGQFEYGNVVSINIKGENKKIGKLYPNPSKLGQINLDYFSQVDQQILVSVKDITGKSFLNERRTILSGENNLRLNLSFLSSGIYFVQIEDDSRLTCRKLIIK